MDFTSICPCERRALAVVIRESSFFEDVISIGILVEPAYSTMIIGVLLHLRPTALVFLFTLYLPPEPSSLDMGNRPENF